MQEQFSFGDGYGLDTVNERLLRADVVIPLRPKTFGVLRYLVEHAGQLVRKSDLLDAVWPDTAVGEAVLKGCIREIREALGDDAKVPRFVVTAHRRGYQFTARVSTSTEFTPPDRPSTAHIFGRDEQLDWLRERLNRALAADRQVAFVAGEPGIGKTTLVDAFVERAAGSANLRVAHGRCLEHYGASEAYLPVLEALSRLCRGAGGER